MVFSSHVFLFFFLPVVLACNYLLPFRSLSAVLTVLSYLFYGWSNPVWVLLMLASSYIDYFCGLGLVRFGGHSLSGADLPFLPKGQPRNRGQRLCLVTSLVSNLGILAFFKYYDFGVTNLEAAAGALGLGPIGLPVLNVALPVGISFYTFQSMSYAIDVYRGEARPLKNPIDFQLLRGAVPAARRRADRPLPDGRRADPAPVVHTSTSSPAASPSSLSAWARRSSWPTRWGTWPTRPSTPASLVWYDAWYGVVAYAFQIYFDFSGYSDMAVGLGLMLGFAFMKNFDAPYLAESITDFWRRWHISLSTWLRDYLYIPLGGNRHGEAADLHEPPHRHAARRALARRVLELRHLGRDAGPAARRGAAHGQGQPLPALPAPLRIAVTFGVTCLAWVFFRAETLPQAVSYFRSLVGMAEVPAGALAVAATIYTPYHVTMTLLCALVVWSFPQVWDFTRRLTPLKAVACLAVFLLSVMIMWTQTSNPFLYYQF